MHSWPCQVLKFHDGVVCSECFTTGHVPDRYHKNQHNLEMMTVSPGNNFLYKFHHGGAVLTSISCI